MEKLNWLVQLGLRLILIKLIKEFPKERYDWTKLSWKTELGD